MNEHDVNRIENALFILLQYKYEKPFENIVSNVISEYGIANSTFFDALEEIKRYF